MKKTLVSVIILIFVLFIFLINHIEKFKTGYIKHNYDSEKKLVSYSLVKSHGDSWVSGNSLPHFVKGAFIVSEDWKFYDHIGVDIQQIQKAIDDYKEGKKLRGASTISQQFVKNWYFSSERSYLRKVFEVILVLPIEYRLSKARILELYLNMIEFGEGLYGLKNASFYYFKKKPKDLTPREVCFLVMLLPNPRIYSTSYKEKKLSEYAEKTINTILYKMKVAKYISEETYNNSLNEKYSWEEQSVLDNIIDQLDLDYFLEN